MEAILAVFICVAALLASTAVTRCDSQGVTTLPPINCTLPLGTSNHVNLICSDFDQPQKCGRLSLHSFVFDLSCNDGHVSGTSDGTSLYTLYANGSWTPRLPQCKRWCKPLRSENVNIRCNYEGNDVDCNQPLPVGTEAIGGCKAGYVPTGNAADSPIVCRGNGEWSHELFNCVAPACGRKTRYSTESVDPWFVAIYRDNLLSCFGTLISSHIVLAAPYCVTESNQEDGKGVISPYRVMVTVGKYFKGRNSDQLRGETVQVRQISVTSQYFGRVTNWAFGIALMDLETSVTSTPACVDWGCEFDVTPGQIGMVAGWDGNGALYNIHAYYINYTSCVSDLLPNRHYIVAPDKFCFTLINRPQGTLDIRGSGYMFMMNDVYYVKGVMSHWWFGTLCSAMSLSDMDLLHWLHQTTKSFVAFHDGL